jgi:hypothetical protein
MERRFLPLSFCTALIFFFSSCGSNQEKSGADAKDADTTGTATQTAPAATSTTIVSTPTNMLVVRHKVTNFNKWKMAYDGHDTARVASGIHNYVVGRGLEDSNDVLVALKVDDVAKAKAFGNNPGMKAAMQKGGVSGKPTMSFTTMVWQDTARTSSNIRSRTTFTVKDFDAWRTSFEGQRQTRQDNGLADRAFGYDMDNHNKVTVVVVVNDTAKARAFWKSDQLKQLRAASGVIGQPERFVYRVVQRY